MAQTDYPKSWAEFKEHSTYWRKKVKKLFGDGLSHIKYLPKLRVNGEDKYNVILAMGSVNTSGSALNTIVYGELYKHEKILLEPLLLADNFGPSTDGRPSAELQMHYERMRGQVGNGVTNFDVDMASGKVFVSTASKLYKYEGGQLTQLCGWTDVEPLNFQYAPIDSRYVAFTSHGRFFIDRDGEHAFSTPEEGDSFISRGTPSFVVQEELERDKGFWWNPREIQLVYEKVDEENVTTLNFAVPGKAPSSPMRYPRVGQPNPRSALHLVTLDKRTGTFEDNPLLVALDDIVSCAEYLSRVNWDAEGKMIYLSLLNRFQKKLTVVGLGRECFSSTNNIDNLLLFIVREEESPVWVNHNNLTYVLPFQDPKAVLMIYGSEKDDKCHLYYSENVIDGESSTMRDRRITSGKWTVVKDVPVVVDVKRMQIYFLATYSSVFRNQLCVCKVQKNAEPKPLTPPDLCYKYDRCDTELSLWPDIGFVCWLSNVSKTPECRFYELMHPQDGGLPSAVMRHTFSIDHPTSPNSSNVSDDCLNPMSPSAMSIDRPISPPINQLYHHEFSKTKLPCGETAFSLVFTPANSPGPFPVVHYVYAGPGLQIVKDSWLTVSQFLKFVAAGYAVVLIDGRGSSNRGIKFESYIKSQLGETEVADQVFVLKKLALRNTFLDMNRVVVTGWSYGGYMALRMLALHPDVYKCACAGGAVVDWKLYDTCYTERYMEFDYDSKYWNANIMSISDKLPEEPNRLLIVHGLIDENVHFAHTEKLIQLLIAAGKPHQLLLFPNERHGVRKADAVEYLHSNMLNFFHNALCLV
ncbi:unnamed protein product [Bursaphelenchus okinawaensis]|uniref:Uncharacterized protein n=1 Tax=Bursaphelenchus okinawaensis TaxID=465554 RepID=A0A811JTW1_9BILA|nr:unnamed protein product [Bursaphelenchus okinawaensis]CAG9082966.1 unnamed protein product [Bursaphelenchus okinawaensis]